MLNIKYTPKYFTEWLNFKQRTEDVNDKQPHTEHKAISLNQTILVCVALY